MNLSKFNIGGISSYIKIYRGMNDYSIKMVSFCTLNLEKWLKIRIFRTSFYYEVKPNILKRAIPRILLFSQYFSFSLISARIFFFLALSFFLSLSQSPCRVLWHYENAIEYARFSLFLLLFPRSRVASALANLNALKH